MSSNEGSESEALVSHDLTPLFFEQLDQSPGKLRCTLCPHLCRFSRDGVGRCGVRGMHNGGAFLPYAGHIAARALDPVEKKPLFHYYPGRQVFSVGFFGCNLRCPFCQNHEISHLPLGSEAVRNLAPQTTGRTPKRAARPASIVTPAELIAEALRSGSFGIAYTYNEPAIHFEYLIECAQRAHKAGLKNILVTAGYLQHEAAELLLRHIDATNVDLKGWRASFYKELGGSLEPVLNFLRLARSLTHLEVTTLLIPGRNDDPTDLHKLFGFVAELGVDVPFHLSAYHPVPGTDFDAPATPPESVLAAIEQAQTYLQYVYPGNITAPAHTICPSCGKQVIRRHGYHVTLSGIDKTGNCTSCGTRIVLC